MTTLSKKTLSSYDLWMKSEQLKNLRKIAARKKRELKREKDKEILESQRTKY